MSKVRSNDTRTVRVHIGDGEEHITVADLLDFADYLRDIHAPADARVYRVRPSLAHGRVATPVALHVDFPRDSDAPTVTPPRTEQEEPDLHHVVEFTISIRTQGYPVVWVREHGPGGIWHVETGRLARTLHLETADLPHALTVARELANTRK